MNRHHSRFTWRALSACCLLAVTALELHAQSVTFTTLAGQQTGGPGSTDGTGSAARFTFPFGVAVDAAGNVYVAEAVTHTIRKITAEGVVTTFAGLANKTGTGDGIGGAARFNGPESVAADSAGNVYVTDASNFTIRKITPSGVVTTLAGSPGQPGSTDGTGSTARFGFPTGVATDSAGNVYVADADNQTIRKITPSGVVTTLAGSPGDDGSSDGTGSAARFNTPAGVATDSSGNVYVADSGNHTIRKITAAGVVTTVAGAPELPGGNDGTGSSARFTSPRAVATDLGGNVYVADSFNNIIRKITPAGLVTTIAGSAAIGSEDGTGAAATFWLPFGVATDNSGNIYVADSFNNAIRKMSSAGVVTTLAGSAQLRGQSDGIGSAARFFFPSAVAIDGSGNVYAADTGNDTIRKITPVGLVTTLAGSPGLAGSADGTGSAARFDLSFHSQVAADGAGNVYVADTENDTIRKIAPSGVVTTLAGSPGLSGNEDGTGSAARFNFPSGVATDGGGNVYAADTFNNTIRKITPAGVVTTLAGSPRVFGSADGTGSAAQFSNPTGVATDSGGNVYVTDRDNGTIRKVTAAGVVTTLAGAAGLFGSADGTGSAARFGGSLFGGLSGVATDRDGNIYVADNANATFRKITSAGVVTTLAGIAGVYGSEDGTDSTAGFGVNPVVGGPTGVAVDGAGNVYVADTFNDNIRVGRPALSDAATIDSPIGAFGAGRQLGTSSQTATSWQWRIIRQPSGSTAALSSTSIRNPVFAPDIADVYVFRLTASNGVNTRISTVTLTATSVPPGPRRRAVGH